MSLFGKKRAAELRSGAVPPEAGGEADLDAVMRKYDRESNTRVWEGVPALVIRVIMALFAVYCIAMTLFSTAMPEIRLPLFVGFIIIMGFLTYPAKKGHVRVNCIPWYDVMLMAVGAGCFFYFAANAMTMIRLSTRIQPVHVAVGCVGILVLVELCRRCVGVPILCVAGVLVVYAFANQLSYNPSFYQALRNIIYKLFYTTSGVIGTPISVCYTYIVLFIIFGAFLERTGIANFFISLANRLAGWSSGGPAKVAVISSALCGMVSGSSVGNTVTTGSVTIPMMKKTGYRPEFAGAVEAAASTGGQIMPPIMGAAAFLMAEYMNLPYAQVAVKAILPAVLYFAGIFIAVHLEAKKMGLKGIPIAELPRWRTLLRDCYLLLPLVLLVWLVATGAKTMSHSAAYSILAAVAVGAVNFFLIRLRGGEDRAAESAGTALTGAGKDTFVSAVGALEAGAKGAVTVAVACAMAGIIAGCITVTGLASILINAIVRVAGNVTIIGLVLTMLCCIVLGMGVPTTANYCIMASTCAPILVQLGFPVVAAHFFVFYFGIVADITPPVALAAYAGSAIAKSDPMKTGVNATKLAIAAFVVPYIFAYSPAMLFEHVAGWWEVLQIAVSALVGLFGIAAALNGHLLRRIPVLLRLALAAGGLCMMVPGTWTDLIGLAVVAAAVVFQYLSGR
ncbi:MAG: TRAP transporter permease [Ruminococcaceae bacterium]|nr:TRAP transporter permease [Oscillospiraceae bacterium]